jgi:hypothetical protein
MLEDLIHNRLLLLGNLDSNPLGDDDGDAAANDVVSWLLLACFDDQGLFDEGVKVDLVVEDIGCETNSSVYGVFEENVFVVGSCGY